MPYAQTARGRQEQAADAEPVAGEGPVGLIVCPSRELARQTHEVVMGYIDSLKKDGFPELRALLAMGGIDMREQVRQILMACTVAALESTTDSVRVLHLISLIWPEVI